MSKKDRTNLSASKKRYTLLGFVWSQLINFQDWEPDITDWKFKIGRETYIQSKVSWRFRKILWPSQDIWTLTWWYYHPKNDIFWLKMVFAYKFLEPALWQKSLVIFGRKLDILTIVYSVWTSSVIFASTRTEIL